MMMNTAAYRQREKQWVAALLLSVCGFFVCGQTVNQWVKAGDGKYAEGDYYAAALYYKNALKKDEQNPAVNYKYAEASRLFNDYKSAAEGYKATTKADKKNEFPLAYFWLGEMLRSSCACKTNEAVRALRVFRAKYRKKDFYSAKCQQDLEACAWAADHNTPNDSIHIEHLGKEVNSEQSEFNAIHVAADKIQFSSLRNISGDDKKPDYKVRIYNQPPTPNAIFMPNGANPNEHVGNGTYAPDGKSFYFTQCPVESGDASRCAIYVSRFKDFKWHPAQRLNDSVNDPSATNTQPAIGFDKQGKKVLFFVSDRTGGQGGLDIWISPIDSNGNPGAAVNAGNVLNTPGNEITPFYDTLRQQLYFSSDWHYGFGGYDIFKSKGEYTQWASPENLLPPVNSPQNDLYYSIAFDNSKAYFSSNRTGSYFIEAETCCNDIYAYALKQPAKKEDTTLRATPVSDSLATAGNISPTFIDETIKNITQKLPVALYFHNDEPDPRTMSDTTKLDYRQTYDTYMPLLELYEKEFTKGQSGEKKEEAKERVDNFFTDKVVQGFQDLERFTEQLWTILQHGNTVAITIKGYCSPLNFNAYNINLGYRRVASLRNYFFHYKQNILLPFIASGQLLLKTESFGEETAAKNISDSREDLRNSVYSPDAALERRVEIISVEVK